MKKIFSKDIDGVIFDVDGVLLDSMPVWHDCGIIYLKGKGIEARKDLGDILFSMTLQEGASYIKENFGLQEDLDTIGKGIMGVVEGFYFNNPKPKEGAVELLENLKANGKKLYVVSSTQSYCIKEAFRHLEVLDLFDGIISCSEEGRRSKEYPDSFFEAAEIMGTSPEKTWVIEDGLYSAKTAKEAGFKTVGVYDHVSRNDRTELESIADMYVESPLQLLDRIVD